MKPVHIHFALFEIGTVSLRWKRDWTETEFSKYVTEFNRNSVRFMLHETNNKIQSCGSYRILILNTAIMVIVAKFLLKTVFFVCY